MSSVRTSSTSPRECVRESLAALNSTRERNDGSYAHDRRDSGRSPHALANSFRTADRRQSDDELAFSVKQFKKPHADIFAAGPVAPGSR